MASPAWQAVVEDLKRHHLAQSYKLVHEIPSSADKMAEQNFERGRLAGWEWILEFEQELREWRERNK